LSTLLDALERMGTQGGNSDPRLARLEPIFQWAGTVAADPKANDNLRSPAIRLLGRDPRKRDIDLRLLSQLLDHPLSSHSQQAVFDSLKRCGGSEVPSLLLTNWTQRPPSQRQSCIQALLARPEWTCALLEAVSAGSIAPTEISLADRQPLLKHSDKEIQQAALALWKPNASRSEILEKYKDATTLPGDAAKGGAVFSKTCATCHFLRGQGHAVGPDLAPLANKSPADFLLAIIDPNAAVEPRFIAYNLDTRDGRSLTGIVSAETATSLTLIQSGGTQETILRGDIQQIRASGVSLMPEGLEQTLSKEDLADLFAYLKTSPRQFGSSSSAQAEAAQLEFLREPVNGIAKLISALDQLPYASWLGTLPMPYTRQTDGHAKLIWQTAAVPADLKQDEVCKFRLPAAMGFASNPSGKFTLGINNKAVIDFDVTLTDKSWQTTDGKLRLDYTVMENNTEDSNGVLIIGVSASILEPGKPAIIEVTGSAANSQRWFGIYLLQPQTAAAVKQ